MIEWITRRDIQAERLRGMLDDTASGGVVIFEGRIRDHHQGKPVAALEYDCHDSLAQAELKRLAGEAARRWPLQKVVLQHRAGPVPLGGLAVFVGVASAHRTEAFEACRWLIDQIKHDVPIWKKETYADGSEVWQEGCDCVQRPRRGASV